MIQLDLSDLANGDIPAITSAIGRLMSEAAGVCLQSQGHEQGVKLIVSGASTTDVALSWSSIHSGYADAWADLYEATEHGAVAVAVLLIKHLTSYEVVQRSRRGTGIDYWLGDDTVFPYTRKARLEVSGILSGTERTVRSRVLSKLRQTERSDATHGGLPAYVIVVEFGTPLAEIHQK